MTPATVPEADPRATRRALCLDRPRVRWRSVRFYFFLPLTAALNVAPAVNLGAFDPRIFSGCPV